MIPVVPAAAPEPEVIDTPIDNEEPEIPVDIVDEEVPLAVVEDTEIIEEEETPLAEKPRDGLKTWWWWIAAGVAGIAGKGVYDANRRRKNKNKDE